MLGKAPRFGPTLIDVLRARAEGSTSSHGYTYLSEREGKEEKLSFADLDQEARRIAAFLQTCIVEGQRGLLLYPPGLNYIAAFWGCLYAGIIVVPVSLPRSAAGMQRLYATLANADVAVVLSTQIQLERIRRFSEQLPGLATVQWVATDTLKMVDCSTWHPPAVSADMIAFLQYTSGATSAPKGVMLSHGNLLHNLESIRQSFKVTEESQGVSWLPPYHDMGLIGVLLGSLYSGCNVTLLSPVEFLHHPVRWLEAISRTHATISGGPNFAYDVCVERISPEQRACLDLSSWQVAFTGAEPIRERTLQRFSAAFRECGFEHRAWYPCYGLAEATLIVSGGSVETPPVVHTFDALALEEQQRAVLVSEQHPASRALVSCGEAAGGLDIAIVEPETCLEVAEGSIGEIWVRGASVAQGYWRKVVQTKKAFQAICRKKGEGAENQAPFLRTGDLGFLYAGELFVTGRLKDVIVVHGRNLYPQDIEWTIRDCHPGVRSCDSAVVGIEDGEHTRIVVIQEIDRHALKTDLEEVVVAIRQAVAMVHMVQVHSVLLVKPGRIPRTSSGKVQHHVCQRLYKERLFEPVYESVLGAGSSMLHEVEVVGGHVEYLQNAVAHILKVAPSAIPLDRPLVAVGLDSLTAFELQCLIEQRFSVRLSATLLPAGASIADLAAYLDQPAGHSSEEGSYNDTQAPLTGYGTESSPQHYPLSHGQRGLWFLYQMAPESVAYHIPIALRLRGQLDKDAMQKALMQLLMRHEILRTTFSEVHGEPVQRVQEVEQSPLVIIDASSWSKYELTSYLQRESERPFDIAHEVPLRLRLLECEPDEYVFVCIVHHILVDLWSLALLMRDLERLYIAAKQGELEKATISKTYRNYVHWQHILLEGAEGQRLWQYWRQQFADGIPSLNMRTDYPRSTSLSYRGAIEPLKIEPGLAEKVQQLSQTYEVTRYVTMLTAFAVLLYRITGHRHIVIGSPVMGRLNPRWAEVAGYFVNTLPLPITFDGRMNFVQLLMQVRQRVQSALEHQAFPLSLMIERLQREHPVAQTALFQVMFVWQQAPRFADPRLALLAQPGIRTHMRLGDLNVETIPLERRGAQAEIALMVAEAEQSLTAVIEYNTDLFDGESIQRLSRHFQTLLASMLADPQQQLARLPLLDEEESVQLLAWGHAGGVYSSRSSVLHKAIEQRAVECPDAVALLWQEQHLTYRELNVRADQVAHYLTRYGICAEQRVGVLLARTPAMVVVLLGILKAGGTYVPLDPAYPTERLRLILADARMKLLVTQRSLESLLPDDDNLPACLFFDEVQDALKAEAADIPCPRMHEEQCAYIIYTSGSTGKPKGVAITHRNACALVDWARTQYTPADLSEVLAATSICFDLSIFELFVPLSSGGTVILARDALDIASAHAHTITLINTVPSVMTEVLRLKMLPASIKVVNLAGEPLSRALADQLYSQPGVERVYNLYGPTEDATYATTALVERGDQRQPSIGHPITGTSLYVLDEDLHPVPIGVIGEIYLGGTGVARGYFQQISLTAEFFVPDPFSSQPGGRMYRTGDLAYYRTDGAVVFCGRYDQQVKLRGYRIELQEVEEVLLQYAQIDAVVAHLWKWQHEEECQLVAYIVPAVTGEMNIDALQQWMRERLPAYMQPRITIVDALPLTASGKVDRRALPPPDEESGAASRNTHRLLTGTEQALVEIWRELLHVSAIGIYDTFFELGGHSLLVTQMLARIRDLFHVELTLRSVFALPTIVNIAQMLHQAQLDKQMRDEPALELLARDTYRKKIRRIAKGD